MNVPAPAPCLYGMVNHAVTGSFEPAFRGMRFHSPCCTHSTFINSPSAPVRWKPCYFDAVIGSQLAEVQRFETAPQSDLINTVTDPLNLEQTLNYEERDLLTAHVSQSITEITLALSQD